MNEFEKIINFHIKKYPEMEIQDLFKLAYQNEFGGGHLIKEPSSSYLYLVNEYEENKSYEVEPIEEIGNGYIRVYLSNLKISIEELNDLFVKSNSSIVGNLDSFKNKLKVIEKMINNHLLNFNKEEFSSFYKKYEKNNFPIISHSEKYRLKYNPHYRVIKKVLFEKYSS